MMDSPPKLTGETLIVHHIPLVHCQVSGSQRCCGSPLRRGSNPFSCPENLGLSRTTSLPERDVLQREALVYSSLIQTSSSRDAFEDEELRGVDKKGGRDGGGGRGGSMASDTSSFTSSNSEDPPSQVLPTKSIRRNPFLLDAGEDEDYEEDEDDDGHNLNGYLEDSSFHLHGNSNGTLENGTDLTPFHLHELGYASGPFHLHESLEKPWCSNSQRGAPGSRAAFDFSTRLEGLDLLGLDGQRRHGSSGSTLSMDCGEQEWGEDDDDDDQSMQGGRGSSECSSSTAQHCSCCGLSQPYPEPFSEPFSDCPLGYASDSSCNSSDGVLVNFSTIYNKLNNGVPAKQTVNLNNSGEQSCTSSVSEPGPGMGGTEFSSGGGAFYLDLHRSPTEPPQPSLGTQDTAAPTCSSSCQCPAKPQGGTVELDANCNSYHNHLGSEGLLSSETSANDLASCLQSQARLVVATQNYYKLVTCDISSQSSPSPAGSSVTSCSDEHSKGSPTQPTEYFLFRRTKEEEEEEEEQIGDADLIQQSNEEAEAAVAETGPAQPNVIEGQVYVNISPPMGGASAGARLRSRSYDRNLNKSPPPRLGSLERMLSCPVRLSEGTAPSPPPPPRVTSFAEIARNKRRAGGGSPSQKTAAAEASSSSHSHSSSGEFSPILEDLPEAQRHSLPPLMRCYSQGSCDTTSPHRHWSGPLTDSPGGTGREARTKAEGGLSISTDSSPAVVRYSKDQRPTTLPIQPFTFQHQFGKSQAKPLLPLLDEYINHMQARGASAPEGGEEDPEEDHGRPHATSAAVRPSPLGSYSPVRLQGAPSCSGSCSTCSPTPERCPRPPRSLSCPTSANLMAHHTPPGAPKLTPLPPTPPPVPLVKQSPLISPLTTRGHCFHRPGLTTLPTLPSSGLSPMGQLEPALQEEEVKVLPACLAQRQHNGQSVRQLQQYYSDFLPDYFSQTERPPEEFCLLRSLEFWFNHMYTHEDIIAAHYHPWGFLPLSQGACQPMFEELLLLLQPLSLLPFDLDLLFEPHQLQKGQEHLRRKEQLCSARHGLDQSARSTFQLMRGCGTLGAEPARTGVETKPEGVGPQRDRFVLRREGTWPRTEGAGPKRQVQRSEGAGSESLEEGARIMLNAGRRSEASRMEGGERSADRMKGVGGEDGERERRRERDGDSARLKSKQAGWWFQLMQSSQVYIDNSAEGSKEGVVEGAEASHEVDERLDLHRIRLSSGAGRSAGNGAFDQSGPTSGPPSEPPRACKGKPSWMGSPPESVLTELKRSKERQPDGQEPPGGAQGQTGAATDASPQNLRWGRLFGAGNAGRTEKPEQKSAKNQKGRLPSGWLSLDRSVLDLVVQSVGVGKRAEPHSATTHSPDTQNTSSSTQETPVHPDTKCEVRALCHHIATETGHLSFHKGDVLQVLGRADSDWLLCALGDAQGLVPIIYVTLNSKESRGSQGPQ
ncbi:hypothetical protein AOLI_G00274550 [Acnodon oligacanthus]